MDIDENIALLSCRFLYRLYLMIREKEDLYWKEYYDYSTFDKEIGFNDMELAKIIHYLRARDYIEITNPRRVKFSNHGWDALANMVNDHDYSDGILPSINEAYPNGI